MASDSSRRCRRSCCYESCSIEGRCGGSIARVRPAHRVACVAHSVLRTLVTRGSLAARPAAPVRPPHEHLLIAGAWRAHCIRPEPWPPHSLHHSRARRSTVVSSVLVRSSGASDAYLDLQFSVASGISGPDTQHDFAASPSRRSLPSPSKGNACFAAFVALSPSQLSCSVRRRVRRRPHRRLQFRASSTWGWSLLLSATSGATYDCTAATEAR